MAKQKQLIARNGRVLKMGSTVNVNGERCSIYLIKGTNIGIESLETGSSWEMVSPGQFNAKWGGA